MQGEAEAFAFRFPVVLVVIAAVADAYALRTARAMIVVHTVLGTATDSRFPSGRGDFLRSQRRTGVALTVRVLGASAARDVDGGKRTAPLVIVRAGIDTAS